MESENDNQELDQLPQAGTSKFNRNDIGRAGSRHKPIQERGFNYARQKSYTDGTWESLPDDVWEKRKDLTDE